ncbi:MAG: hypothetical protein KU37_04100 [Sulfuricurvum sp. PC08-66]|nr:MAG: hypothetical protein KU37_04100 [Sulfuricurvum sp. PC08-66]
MKNILLTLLFLLFLVGCETRNSSHPIIAEVKAQTVGSDIDTNRTHLVVIFKEAMNFASFDINSFSIVRDDSGTILPYTISTSDSITYMVELPLLVSSSSYTITVGATLQYLDGTPIGNTYTYTFTTLSDYNDYLPPEINNSFPLEGETNVSIFASLKFAFNEPIDTTRLIEATITLQDDTYQDINFTYKASEMALFVIPAQPLQSDTNYTLSINSLCDTNSNCYNYALHFSTQSTAVPLNTLSTSYLGDAAIASSNFIFFFDSTPWANGYYLPMEHGYLRFYESNGSMMSYTPTETNTTLLDIDVNYWYNPDKNFTLESNGTHTMLYRNGHATVVAGAEYNFTRFDIDETKGCFIADTNLTLVEFYTDYNISNTLYRDTFVRNSTLRDCAIHDEFYGQGLGIAYSDSELLSFGIETNISIRSTIALPSITHVAMAQMDNAVAVAYDSNRIALYELNTSALGALALRYDAAYEHNVSRVAIGDGVLFAHVAGTNSIAALRMDEAGFHTLGTIDTNDTILSMHYHFLDTHGTLIVAHPWGIARYDVDSVTSFAYRHNDTIPAFGARQNGRVLFASDNTNNLLYSVANGIVTVLDLYEHNTTSFAVPSDVTSIAIVNNFEDTTIGTKLLLARGNNGIDIYHIDFMRNPFWDFWVEYNSSIAVSGYITDMDAVFDTYLQSSAYNVLVGTYSDGLQYYKATDFNATPTLMYDNNSSSNYVAVELDGFIIYASTADKRIEHYEWFNSTFTPFSDYIETVDIALDLQSTFEGLFAALGTHGVLALQCPSTNSGNCSYYDTFATSGYAVALAQSTEYIAGSSYNYTLFIADTLGIGSVNYREGFYNSEVDTLHYSPSKRPVRGVVAPIGGVNMGIFTSDGNGTIDNYTKYIPANGG